MNQVSPKVSIGLPVYNGKQYLSTAIESLLAQTFSDFEIIICDNASDDGTDEICHKFAKADHRIQYYRNSKNIGAAPNYNRTFELASGEYFKWAAHDDICKPDYLKRCVDVLDRDKGVVIAYPKTMIIDERGQKLDSHRHRHRLPFDSACPTERFEASLINDHCYEVFGLIRRHALAKTDLIGTYAHGDGVLLARLALVGRFEEIPEYLFCLRSHSEQSTHMWVDYRQYAEWFKPNIRGEILFPYCRMHFEYFRSINMVPLNLSVRLRCYKHLIDRIFTRRNFLREEIAFYCRQKLPMVRTVYRGLKKIIRA